MAAGSFKIYGLQKDGSRIPAAGGVSGGGGASEIITLTQTEFDALSQTDIANYHANGVRTILVNSMTDILRSYGIDAAGNAIPIADPGAVRQGDVVAMAADSQKLGGMLPSEFAKAGETGGITMELLWENASLTSAFAEQSITLSDFSDASMLMVYFGHYSTAEYFIVDVALIPCDMTGREYMVFYGQGNWSYVRKLTLDTSTRTITFTAADDTDGSNSDNSLIPVKIYKVIGGAG